MAGTGKSYRGQATFPIKTPDDVQAEIDAQKPFAHPDAISLNVYFSLRGFRDPTLRAAMEAYTKVRTATLLNWDDIFKDF